ncbi:protein kinase C zeta type-like, partial [Theropithecus gelada]|uniref:protein kinase C zeta type-like n=1 Tax=Theropithecus gelada TaxID=9565 RepID=UPI000DC190B7
MKSRQGVPYTLLSPRQDPGCPTQSPAGAAAPQPLQTRGPCLKQRLVTPARWDLPCVLSCRTGFQASPWGCWFPQPWGGPKRKLPSLGKPGARKGQGAGAACCPAQCPLLRRYRCGRLCLPSPLAPQCGLGLTLCSCLQRAYCGQCSERIWGLARQGYRCINCKLLVHKRCHGLVPLTCRKHMDSVMPSQEPPVDDKSEDADLPSEETDGIAYISSSRKHDSIKDDSEDLKPVIDGMDGIKISQGLGLQDFDLIRVIGRGSYAKVLLVRLKKNDQIYAMKVVKKELVHDDERPQKRIPTLFAGHPGQLAVNAMMRAMGRDPNADVPAGPQWVVIPTPTSLQGHSGWVLLVRATGAWVVA